MNHDWKPTLGDGDEPLYERLVAALERDVREGLLIEGARLPPQRILAYDLNLSVGTVTKAYVEAERRGLVRGHVGRGTFVAGPWGGEGGESEPPLTIDLALNVIPHQPAARRFADTLSALKRSPELFETLSYGPVAGVESHRRAAAAWLARVAQYEPDWNQLVITGGAQHAMGLAMATVCSAGDTVLCEAATYYGMKSLAEHAGYKLHAVPMDDQGVIPEALEEAAASTGSRVFYTMPTVHNPTARTMGTRRREAVARIARKRNLWVVEDDNYPLFAPRDRECAPLAGLIPDRCFYIGGASKSLAPGLRLGFLVCPSETHQDAALRALRATSYAIPTLGALVFSQWVEDQSAFEIGAAVRAEIDRRFEIARQFLDASLQIPSDPAPHIWLPMPELEAERVAGRALREGVAVTPPDAPVVAGSMISGLRICLGAASTASELSVGLERLSGALAPVAERALQAMV